MNELIEKAKQGCIESFEKLILYYQQDLYRIAKIRLNTNDDISDAIQNTIINIYKNLKKLKNNTYFKTWIIKILINECNKIYKDNMKKNIIIEKKALSTNQEYFLEENKLYDFWSFNSIISNLTKEEQLIFSLFYKDKYSCKEIAKILKLKENTIKSKLDRGRKKLKNYIKEDM